MSVAIEETDRYVESADMRLPFGFGNVTVTRQPQLFVAVTTTIDGERARGLAADGLSPLWFMKETEFTEGMDRLLEVIDVACEFATMVPPSDTVFDWWKQLYDHQQQWAEGTEHPPLLWAYGVSLIERALIDAFCRSRGLTFAKAVRDNALGLRLETFHDELAGADPGALLPERPRRSVTVRHTVAHEDPLTDDEIPTEHLVDDGLPQSLAEYVRRYGIDHFKIKLFGDRERDVDRLTDIAAVLDAHLPAYTVTLDANEQFADVENFKRFWTDLTRVERLDEFRESVAYVEQPLPRSAALDDRTKAVLNDWRSKPPVIIDESDARLGSLARALDCGYAGTSHKNVKGVFKGVANACRIAQLRRENPDAGYVMSGEDSSNVGPVALLQDFAVVATLGLEHVERNGHRCFRGLSMFPRSVQEETLAAHGDVFQQDEIDTPSLHIRDGRVRLDSVVDAPFGYDFDLDVAQFTPYEEWSLDA